MISFATFYAAVHDGRQPYPWQQAFAERLADERRSPTPAGPLSVHVPTGCGKASAIDALVWALASQADRPHHERTVGVRIVWAINRRLLVDEIADHADRLAVRLMSALADPADDLHDVASRLESLKAPEGAPARSGTLLGRPLVVSRWRGTTATPHRAEHPMQVEIVTSTVAQIGSRLLFRGYGVDRASLPTAAALAACDTTVCLADVQSAAPFTESFSAVVARRTRTHDTVAPTSRLISLSSHPVPALETEPRSEDNRVDLGDADVVALGPRLTGPKWARLVSDAGDSDKEQASAVVSAVGEHLDAGRTTIACVANSVRTARAIFSRIRKQHPAPHVDVLLLVGSQRPVDRQRMLDAAMPGPDAPTRYAVLREHAEPSCPLVVVTTQAFEVGCDFDVEAMVTQSASAAALVQRLGRLNRAGDRVGYATIIRTTDSPLYAGEEDRAWTWLLELPRRDTAEGIDHPTVDVSVETLHHHAAPMTLPTYAPELTDATVDALMQTGSQPHAGADPDIDAFLRGGSADPASDVTLCWRSDLYEDDDSDGADTAREALLRLAPPHPDEQATVSVVVARHLIGIRTGQIRASAAKTLQLTEDTSDVEGDAPAVAAGDMDDPDRQRSFQDIPFVVRRGDQLLRGRKPDDDPGVGLGLWDLRPGDLVVLPTALGGVDEFGIAGTASTANDVAADVTLPQTAPSEDDQTVVLAAASGHPVPVRITRQALDVALATSVPLPGPRSQHISRILRRTATIEQRIERSRSPGARRQALGDLFTVLAEHPVISRLELNSTELRRITPTLPPEWTDPVDDISGHFQGTSQGDLSPLSLTDLTTNDEDDADVDVLDGEDRPLGSDAWVLIPVSTDTTSDVRAERTAAFRAQVRPRGDEPPSLSDHAQAVAERAAWFARSSGMSEEIVDAITVAARAHDHGKVDQRMQAFFRGGVASPMADPLAQSVFGTDDRRAARTARLASGLPEDFAYEQASVAILAHALSTQSVTGLSDVPGRRIDTNLALHVAGAHRGWFRPWLPVARNGSPVRTFAVDIAGVAGVAHTDGQQHVDAGSSLRRFFDLNRRYGPWTLAYLEALLVLADRTVSTDGH